MIGPLLKSILTTIQRQAVQIIRKPSNQRLAVRALAQYLQSPEGQQITKPIEEGFEKAFDFVSSIRIKIVNRRNEAETVIDLSTRVTYSARNIQRSNVIQGANITINNITLYFLNPRPEDISQLKTLASKFKELERRCSSASETKVVNDIKLEYKTLSSEMIEKISRITNYEQLQAALGTLDQAHEYRHEE